MIAHRQYLVNNKAKIKVKSDHVEVDGAKLMDTVKPATPSEVFFPNKQERAAILGCSFFRTDVITCKGSHFQLFHMDVPTTDYCNLAYQAISNIPAIAGQTHLISAYTLDSGEFGWNDDDDHGLGKFLLSTMEKREMQNGICFLTRHYGGQHIGKRRYEIIQQLVTELLVNMEAKPDEYGNRPYIVRAPPMNLPHPSSKEKAQLRRHTAMATRRSDFSDHFYPHSDSMVPRFPPSNQKLVPTDDSANQHSDYPTSTHTDSHKSQDGEQEVKPEDMDATMTDQNTNEKDTESQDIPKSISDNDKANDKDTVTQASNTDKDTTIEN